MKLKRVHINKRDSPCKQVNSKILASKKEKTVNCNKENGPLSEKSQSQHSDRQTALNKATLPVELLVFKYQ